MNSQAYREEKAQIGAFLRKYRRLLYHGPLTPTQALYANAYYLEDKTMEQVAAEFGVSLPSIQHSITTTRVKLFCLMEKERECGEL